MIDFHNDTFLKVSQFNLPFQQGSDLLQIDVPKIRKSKVSSLFFSIWANPLFTNENATHYLQNSVNELKNLIKISNLNDIGIFLCVEGGFCLRDSADQISKLSELKVQRLTLAHFNGPSWAGSCNEGSKGLNKLGREIIKELENQKVVVDIAHCSFQTMMDVAAVAKKPFVYSHGGVQSLNPLSERCISETAIKKVCDSGGVIGISFFPGHLCGKLKFPPQAIKNFWKRLKTELERSDLTLEEKFKFESKALLLEYPKPLVNPGIEMVFRHIDYIVRNFGDDFVCIGSDFDGIPYTCLGLESIDKIDSLEIFMQEAGYGKVRIEKILKKNIQRIFACL